MYSNSVWSPKYNTTIVAAPRCQCPPGSSFVWRNLAKSRWKSKCEGNEVQVGWDQCVEDTGQSRDMEMGRTSCCQLKEGSCTPDCAPGQWRLANGFCESAMLQGCYDFSQEDYAAGENVRCHIPATEIVITKDECKSEGDVWIVSNEFGGSYCKRSTSKWQSLRSECNYRIDKTKLNVKNCRNFDRRSFTPPAPPVMPIRVSYFSFLSETSIVGEGSPAASGTGERLTGQWTQGYNGHNEDLPWSYQTDDQRLAPLTSRELNSARQNNPYNPYTRTIPSGRRLLYAASVRNAAVELQEAMSTVSAVDEKEATVDEPSETGKAEKSDTTMNHDATAEFIFPRTHQTAEGEALQPMAEDADLEQKGYLKKRKNERSSYRKKPEGGFYTYKGLFELTRHPSMPNEDIDMDAESLLQVNEGFDLRGGRVDPLREVKRAMQMEELVKAGEEFKKAKDRKLPPMHTARPGEGSLKKACIPPPAQAECFAYLYSGKELKGTKKTLTGSPSQCLSAKDNAWFRIHCEQY